MFTGFVYHGDMPSSSRAQARLMAGVAHGWQPDRVKAPPVKVAREFNQADAQVRMRALDRRRQIRKSAP